MIDIKDKQLEIYNFLKTYTENKGYPPSVREICEAVGLSSTSTVHGHLKRLEKKGLIKRDPSKPRALEIAELNQSKKEMINIPIIGKVTAGLPILATENIEDTFPVPLEYVKHDRELFMLRVTGQSMINVGINNNDLAIIEKKESAENGDIAAVDIEGNATLKTYRSMGSQVILMPENDAYEPIMLEEGQFNIIGTLVGVIKQ